MNIIKYDQLEDNFFDVKEPEELKLVTEIIKDVKENGDIALKKYSLKFDGVDLDKFEISLEEINVAYKNVDENLIKALKKSIKNVRTFASRQLKSLKKLNTKIYGCKLGHKIIPVEKVGCYVPGGNYPLPSSAIMTIIPAKVAKVNKIYAFSPKIKPETIVAMDLAGADKIYNIGGVQAIAAMAYGTQTIEKVNKIVGPGNKYVQAAKKEVYGICGIDFLAGPSEIMVIADETSKINFVASDILAQCEHDIDSRAYLVCFDEKYAQKVKEEANLLLEKIKTKEIAQESYKRSTIIIVDNIQEAVDIANKLAPEHLELCFNNAINYIDHFRNYGSMFIGNYSAEVFGDYCSGTNHTLPTNRVAKYCGGLSVFDFIKVQTYQMSSKLCVRHLSKTASIISKAEGLDAHCLSSNFRGK